MSNMIILINSNDLFVFKEKRETGMQLEIIFLAEFFQVTNHFKSVKEVGFNHS